MNAVAPLITGFLREHLPTVRGCSPHTCEAYAYAFKLLFEYAGRHYGVRPSQLCIEQLDVSLVLAFLNYLENERRNDATTRNARLAAIKAFMHFTEFKLPSVLEQSRQIHAIPSKRHDQALIRHLTTSEIRAILEAPLLETRPGIRDRAMLHLCFSARLRVSELVGLTLSNLTLGESPSLRVLGKRRKERCLPLWKEAASDLRAWLAVRGDVATPELFVNARGSSMTRSGFEYVLRKHAKLASEQCPSLKRHAVSPHQMRHSCAVLILQATGDIRKVALGLGHEDIRTTEVYLRVDPIEKLEAIESTLPPFLRKGRFKAPDDLIASLQDP